MAITPDEIKRWLGDGWRVVEETASAAEWQNAAWRTEYLCSKVDLGLYYVYDEPGAHGKQRVCFAAEDLGR